MPSSQWPCTHINFSFCFGFGGASPVRHGETSRNGQQWPILKSPRPRVGWRSNVGFLGSGSGHANLGVWLRYRTSWWAIRPGILLRLGPSHAFADDTCTIVGRFSSCCPAPAPNDNDIRGGSTTGVPRECPTGNSVQDAPQEDWKSRCILEAFFSKPPRMRPGPSCLAGSSWVPWLGIPCQ